MITSVQRETISPVQTSGELRVLHLHSGNMMGGIESVLITIAENAGSCTGFAQEIALAFDGPFAQKMRLARMDVHPLAPPQLRNPISIRKSRRDLQRLLDKEDFDAVISHSPWCQAVYGPVLKASGRPIVFWMHGSFDGHWLQKLASRHVPDFVICNSEYTRSTLPKVYPKVASAVLHLPVGNLSFCFSREEIRGRLEVLSGTVVILMASRMEHWKGHLNLLHAAAQIETNVNWEIWIAGAPQTKSESDYFDSVVAEVERAGLKQRVKFLGQRNDVPDLMRASDIFCQPNASPEPFGVVFVEALQAGIPVVTFDMGGPHEFLDAKSGVLVPPRDIAGLSKALQGLINNPHQREIFRSTAPARARELCDAGQQMGRLHQTIAAVARIKKGAVS